MLTIRDAMLQGAKLLEDAAVAAPRLNAEVLLCHALGADRPYLFAHATDPLTELAWIHYGRYLHQRVQGVPTQHITKKQEFFGREFRVTPDVLIPRPETEHVIEVAVARAPDARKAVDIGCGSGAIGITWSLESGHPAACTDVSLAAVLVAKGNATRLGARVEFAVCDLDAALSPGFDLVLSNPPYIPESEGPALQREVRDHEPPIALYGGSSGVEVHRRLIAGAARILKPGGWLVMEIGYRGEPLVRAMLAGPWSSVETTYDLAGWPRVVSCQHTP